MKLIPLYSENNQLISPANSIYDYYMKVLGHKNIFQYGLLTKTAFNTERNISNILDRTELHDDEDTIDFNFTDSIGRKNRYFTLSSRFPELSFGVDNLSCNYMDEVCKSSFIEQEYVGEDTSATDLHQVVPLTSTINGMVTSLFTNLLYVTRDFDERDRNVFFRSFSMVEAFQLFIERYIVNEDDINTRMLLVRYLLIAGLTSIANEERIWDNYPDSEVHEKIKFFQCVKKAEEEMLYNYRIYNLPKLIENQNIEYASDAYFVLDKLSSIVRQIKTDINNMIIDVLDEVYHYNIPEKILNKCIEHNAIMLSYSHMRKALLTRLKEQASKSDKKSTGMKFLSDCLLVTVVNSELIDATAEKNRNTINDIFFNFDLMYTDLLVTYTGKVTEYKYAYNKDVAVYDVDLPFKEIISSGSFKPEARVSDLYQLPQLKGSIYSRIPRNPFVSSKLADLYNNPENYMPDDATSALLVEVIKWATVHQTNQTVQASNADVRLMLTDNSVLILGNNTASGRQEINEIANIVKHTFYNVINTLGINLDYKPTVDNTPQLISYSTNVCGLEFCIDNVKFS